MKYLALLAACIAAASAANGAAGTLENPVKSQLSPSCPLTGCYVEPVSTNQKRSPPAIACAMGFNPPDDQALPKGCTQRCKPCRAQVCTAVCQFEAFCQRGPCPEALAKMMAGSGPESGGSCPNMA